MIDQLVVCTTAGTLPVMVYLDMSSLSLLNRIVLFSCRWVPVYMDKEQTLGVMSIGFLLHNNTDAVIWRGPKKNGNCPGEDDMSILFILSLSLKQL